MDDPGGLKPIEEFLVAAAAAAALRRARLGLMGYPFPGMGDFAVDTTHLVATLGCQWTSLPVEEYAYKENRFRSLKAKNPDLAAKLLKQLESDISRRWQYLSHLASWQPGQKE